MNKAWNLEFWDSLGGGGGGVFGLDFRDLWWELLEEEGL